MNTQQIDKVKEALSLLSAERVNTSGLGAPINILKRLVEDSEPVAPIDKTLTAESVLSQFESFKDTNDGRDETHYYHDNVIEAMESYANLRVEQAKEEERKEAKICVSRGRVVN